MGGGGEGGIPYVYVGPLGATYRRVARIKYVNKFKVMVEMALDLDQGIKWGLLTEKN